MCRLISQLLLVAILSAFLAHRSIGGPLSRKSVRLNPPTIQEKNYSSAQDLLHVQAKPKLAALKSNSILKTMAGLDSASSDVLYFATHHTYSGGRHDTYYGLLTTMDVYGLELKRGQWSSTSVWVTNNGDGVKANHNAIIAGWHIYPEFYGDSRTHFYTYYTKDGYQSGCLNVDCPGFVIADGATIAPGAVIDPVSDAKNGHLQNVTLKIFKDKTSGDWWIYYGFNSIPTGVGYYPKSLFTSMVENSSEIKFGGFAASARVLPSPPLGTGAAPNGGQSRRAVSFTDLCLIDQDGKKNPIVDDLPTIVSNSQCYSITPIARAQCFYGGPGACM
ncbi:hypothetical protein ACP4OV_024793 [Aristida adscensionis]